MMEIDRKNDSLICSYSFKAQDLISVLNDKIKKINNNDTVNSYIVSLNNGINELTELRSFCAYCQCSKNLKYNSTAGCVLEIYYPDLPQQIYQAALKNKDVKFNIDLIKAVN